MLHESLDNLGMAMPLIDSGIGGKKVVITFAFGIPHIHSLAFCQYYGQGMIVVSAIFFFQLDGFFGTDVAIFQCFRHFFSPISVYFSLTNPIPIKADSVKQKRMAWLASRG